MDNYQLVAFAESKIGTPYVYGMKGSILTLEKYRSLKKAYGSYVWDSDIKKVGKICCDCSGLISWATGIQRGSTQYKNAAEKIYTISSVAKAPIGALVWKSGHIGIYIGNGEYIAEDGSAYGCRKNKISKTNFTHWFLCCDIEYVKKEEQNEMVEKSKIVVDGIEIEVRRILKDGTNYIAVRDLAEAVGYSIGNDGNIAVLKQK